MKPARNSSKTISMVDRTAVIAEVADEYDIEADLLQAIVDLEADHQNLHRHGAIQDLRRAIESCLKEFSTR